MMRSKAEELTRIASAVVLQGNAIHEAAKTQADLIGEAAQTATAKLELVREALRERGRDVLLLCSGERGARSLEDYVCAGLLVERLTTADARVRPTPASEEAAALARPYGKDVSRLARDSSWARHLDSRGRAADLDACLTLDTATIVPVFRAEFDKVVAARG